MAPPRQKPHSPAGGCEDSAVLRCNNTPHSSFMAVPETAKVARTCVHVTRRCCVSCQVFSSRSPSAELQASDRTPDLEGRLEPGKEEPVQAPHPGYTQTATYNRQIWSSAPQHSSETRPYLLQLTLPMGAYFWLKHSQVSLEPPFPPPRHRQQGRDSKHRTLLLKHLPA